MASDRQIAANHKSAHEQRTLVERRQAPQLGQCFSSRVEPRIHRSEHRIVVRGAARVTADDDVKTVHEKGTPEPKTTQAYCGLERYGRTARAKQKRVLRCLLLAAGLCDRNSLRLAG
jgi:hypothetical protein